MSRKPTAPKNTPWNAIHKEDWAKGYGHVARLTGVSRQSARTAHKRLEAGRSGGRRGLPVPGGLRPTDSPAAVVKEHGVSLRTAKKWLRSVGRQPGAAGRPRRA
jgi:hypothetical protein